MLTRILAPLDGSPAMAEIAPSLRHLVGGTGAVVHLLAVRPPVRRPEQRGEQTLYLDDLQREERRIWQAYLAQVGSQLAYDGVVVRREVRFGEPLAETVTAAKLHGVQLIALAAPAQHSLQRALRPSLAQQLLTQSEVPVLAVPVGRDPRQGLVLRYQSLPV